MQGEQSPPAYRIGLASALAPARIENGILVEVPPSE